MAFADAATRVPCSLDSKIWPLLPVRCSSVWLWCVGASGTHAFVNAQ